MDTYTTSSQVTPMPMQEKYHYHRESDDNSIKLESFLLRMKELEEEIHAQDEEQSTKDIEDDLARTQAKIKYYKLQEDIDSMTKEGILNKEASVTLAMITARVGLMFFASPFSGFGVGVDAIVFYM